MARYRRSRGRRTSHDIGRERARQHIEDAKRLTAELGGMDQDVKAYFFSLPPAELSAILTEYGERFGSLKEEYAREVFERWRTGARQMSGTVAERLFKLLPPRMPLRKKYELAEGLWHHVGPSSKRTMRIGLDADVEDIVALAAEHIEEVVTEYRIPEQLERRFEWLSAGDVGVKQDLLNHLRGVEKSLVVEAARVKMPIMLDHLRSDAGRRTGRLAEVLKVGKHELELLLDRNASGATIETPSAPAWGYGNAYGTSGQQGSPATQRRGWGWLWLIGLWLLCILIWRLLS